MGYHKRLMFTTACLIGALTLASAPSMAAAKTQITFCYKALAGAETEAFKSIIADFEKKNPSIKVKQVNVIALGGSWIEKLLAMIAGGQNIDVMNMEYQFAIPLVIKKVVLPLDDFIKSDKSFDLKAYFKSSVGAFTYKGKIYGIPYTAQSHNMFVNKDALIKAGMAFPGNNWTIDELTEAMKRTTKDKNGDGKPDHMGMVFDVSATRTANFLYPFGARITTENREKCILSAPESVKAFKWLYDMVNAYKVATPSGSQGKFESGTATFYTSGPWIVSMLRNNCKFGWDILPYPKGPGGQGSTLGADAFLISGSSKHRQAAWALVKHFTNAESLKKLGNVGASLPSRQDSLREILAKGPKIPANTDAYEIGIDTSVASPVTSAWMNVSTIFGEITNNILNGKIGVEAGLKAATDQINKQLARDIK